MPNALMDDERPFSHETCDCQEDHMNYRTIPRAPYKRTPVSHEHHRVSPNASRFFVILARVVECRVNGMLACMPTGSISFPIHCTGLDWTVVPQQEFVS